MHLIGNVIVSINPGSRLINVNLDEILQVSTKHIQITQIEGEEVQFFKYLKVSMNKYVLHSYFYSTDIDDVNIVLGYHWMDLVGKLILMCQKSF